MAQLSIPLDQLRGIILNLGIPIDNKSYNNRIGVICPYHDDTNFGNCFIFAEDSALKCYCCGKYISLINLIMDNRGYSYSDAMEFAGVENSYYPSKRQQNNVEKREDTKYVNHNNTALTKFNPNDYLYTKRRRYTIEFMEHFKIKKCYEGFYKDYMIIPLNEANTFEARKIYEEELIIKLLGITEDNLKKLRSMYLIWRKDNKNINNEITEYLDKPRTHYPHGTLKDKPILFNQSNLNYNEDLYITEGTASLPQIWTHKSKNCTCTFGSQISDMQLQTLKSFKKRKIFIPDNDTASMIMLQKICKLVPQVYVINITSNDTDDDYIQDIINTTPVLASYYIIEKQLLNGSEIIVK